MVTMFDDSLLLTIGNLRKFIDGVLPITFRPLEREERSKWIRSTLVRFKYMTLRRAEKGVYHINLVDEVTQWEVVVAVEQISEECVEPALEEAFSLFPFRIKNFHSDNGSEYINDVVHQFITRWKAKQTKGRPRHSNDNGLAETKNGAIIRKHMGYRHIPQPYASRINVFYREHLIPYVNFHRPSAFPEITTLPNGKKIVKYKEYKTPLQKFLSLEKPEQYLSPGVTLDDLRCQAAAKLPNQAAEDMQEAKRRLFSILPPLSHGIL